MLLLFVFVSITYVHSPWHSRSILELLSLRGRLNELHLKCKKTCSKTQVLVHVIFLQCSRCWSHPSLPSYTDNKISICDKRCYHFDLQDITDITKVNSYKYFYFVAFILTFLDRFYQLLLCFMLLGITYGIHSCFPTNWEFGELEWVFWGSGKIHSLLRKIIQSETQTF